MCFKISRKPEKVFPENLLNDVNYLVKNGPLSLETGILMTNSILSCVHTSHTTVSTTVSTYYCK